jgi:hypothetical protein
VIGTWTAIVLLRVLRWANYMMNARQVPNRTAANGM